MSNENKKKLAPEAYDVRLPKNAYKLRVVEADNERSKKNQSRMAKLICEIIENDPIEHNGKAVDINGIELMHFSVVTAKSLKFANQCRAAFGLPALTEDDIDVFDAKDFMGRTGYALCQSTLEPQINEVTKEPVINPYTKEPLMQVRREIVEWIPKPAGFED